MSQQTTTQGPVLGLHCLHARIDEIKAQLGAPPWSRRIAITDHNVGALIYQEPGHPNDRHFHLEDEWWLVLEGEIHWEMEGVDEPIRAKAGDFVFAPKNTFHHIHVVGNKPAVRLAISVPGEPHRHEREGG
jgi:quercetin dioxygenase-like cupin family protein